MRFVLFVACLTDCQVNLRINCYNNLIYLWQMRVQSIERFPESNVFEYVLYWINEEKKSDSVFQKLGVYQTIHLSS